MAAKIEFPNRACPKCGKAIHVRTKSHDCGWTANAAAPPAKASPMKSAAPKTAMPNGKSLSKMEAVRRVLAQFGKDTMPVEIQGLLKSKFNIKMDPTVISTYKSSILRNGVTAPKTKLGRPAKAHVVPKAGGTGSISIDDIKAVKELAERLGAEKLRQLADVLA